MKVAVAFAGGGTGGHIYPGLAVADSLRTVANAHGVSVEIVWLGSSRGNDRKIVEKNVDDNGNRSADVFYGIPSGKLRRHFSVANFFQNFIDVFKIMAGFFSSLVIFIKIKPAVLFSKGGFVSVPPCVAARILGIPVFTHECDFTPGLATRLNARFAKNIFVTYDETVSYFKSEFRKKCVVTGNPVRPVFYNADKGRGLEFLGLSSFKENFDVCSANNGSSENETTDSAKHKPLLVVVGGSSGARQINDLVAENIEWICEHFDVVHQTGKNDISSGATGGDAAGGARDDGGARVVPVNYKKFEFIYNEMPDVLCAADVVLSRAGANSIWECATLGKPMVLIPLMGSGTRGDQVDNAMYFFKKGAAIVLEGADADAFHLKVSLETMLDKNTRVEYARDSASLCSGLRPSEKIARLLFEEISGIISVDEISKKDCGEKV